MRLEYDPLYLGPDPLWWCGAIRVDGRWVGGMKKSVSELQASVGR